jgi:hypothetical protein
MRTAVVPLLVTVTVAPVTTAERGSVAVPTSVLKVDWAKAECAQAANRMNIKLTLETTSFLFCIITSRKWIELGMWRADRMGGEG